MAVCLGPLPTDLLAGKAAWAVGTRWKVEIGRIDVSSYADRLRYKLA